MILSESISSRVVTVCATRCDSEKKLSVFAVCFILIPRLVFNPCRLIRMKQIIHRYITLFGSHHSVDINTKQLWVLETCPVNFHSWGYFP